MSLKPILVRVDYLELKLVILLAIMKSNIFSKDIGYIIYHRKKLMNLFYRIHLMYLLNFQNLTNQKNISRLLDAIINNEFESAHGNLESL